ncbi:MAG: pantoate--beta-alanine ligase [Parvularculaceae bacterium]
MPEAPVDSQIGVVRTRKALKARIDAWRAKGETVGFVPTMGALHDGHLSLIRRSRSLADHTVASIFVNPAQFAPTEDFGSYPRHEADDLEKLASAGCSLVYLPGREEIYPQGFQTSVTVDEVSKGLCGDSRPHFFGGVATVVCKLLNQVRPDFAVFGEKDFQQLLVIKRMVKDLDMTVEIVGAPVMREKDGLAMSSRNAYLSAEDRATAGKLNQIIAKMAAELEHGAIVESVIDKGRANLAAAGFSNIDYLEVRAIDNLTPVSAGSVTKPARIFVAAILGKTRLIDNWPINPRPA